MGKRTAHMQKAIHISFEIQRYWHPEEEALLERNSAPWRRPLLARGRGVISTTCARRHRSRNRNAVAMSLYLLPLKDILVCLIWNKPEGWLHVNAPQTSISNNAWFRFCFCLRLPPAPSVCVLNAHILAEQSGMNDLGSSLFPLHLCLLFKDANSLGSSPPPLHSSGSWRRC